MAVGRVWASWRGGAFGGLESMGSALQSRCACRSFAVWKPDLHATLLAASRSFSALASEMPLMATSLRLVRRMTWSAVVTPDSASFLMSEVC